MCWYINNAVKYQYMYITFTAKDIILLLSRREESFK